MFLSPFMYVFFPFYVCFCPPIGDVRTVLDLYSSADKRLNINYVNTTTAVLLIFRLYHPVEQPTNLVGLAEPPAIQILQNLDSKKC